MKIYTKTGDSGTTGLIDGTRVSKCHPQIEAYASTDELNSQIGYFCALSNSQKDCDLKECVELQISIQSLLFQIGSALGCSAVEDINKFLKISISDIEKLEREIDNMSAELPPLKSFILPGGSLLASQSHILRTLTRKSERRIVALNEKNFSLAIQYLNRLSDYYFTLARWLNHSQNTIDIEWQARK